MSSESTVQRFGESWGAPVNEGVKVSTPAGEFCLDCDKPIFDDDQGLMLPHVTGAFLKGGVPQPRVVREPHHRDCFLRTVGL